MSDESSSRDADVLLRQHQRRQAPSVASARKLFVLCAVAVLGLGLVSVALLSLGESYPNSTPSHDHLRHGSSLAAQTPTIATPTEPIVNVRIPRIIHQIGSTTADLPARVKPWMRSWIDGHPGWRYVFWTHNETRALLERLYPRYSSNITAEDVNMMGRHAILHAFGGLFASNEMECVQTFDDLHEEHDVLIGTTPFASPALLDDDNSPYLSNLVLASTPKHQFWLHVLESVLAGNTSTSSLLSNVYKAAPASTTKRVRLLGPEYFFPDVSSWDREEMTSHCSTSKQSSRPVKDACAWLEMYPHGQFTKATHTVQHWIKDRQTRTEYKNTPTTTLWEVMKLSNGASAITFEPRFYTASNGLQRVELMYRLLA